jgi:cysteine desulfurase
MAGRGRRCADIVTLSDLLVKLSIVMVQLPIYMDNHSTTRCDPRVLEVMLPFFGDEFGNAASTTHEFGRRAAAAVERAREQVAAAIGGSAKEIVFTSGATESDNLAIKGAAAMLRKRGNHIVTVVTEHHAVLDPCKRLAREGYEVTFLPVDRFGLVDPDATRKAITDQTILISIMAANNEIGTIHSLAEIGRIARERGVLFHTDATQAVGKIPIDVETMHIDLLSLSAHKMYGPKGVGALYVRRKPPVRLAPLFDGGGHERNMRSGTLPVPLVVGFGRACELSIAEMGAESCRLTTLRERLHRGLESRVEQITLNGHPTGRLPGNLNLSFAYVEGEALLMSMKHVAVSSGSACTSANPEPSYVLKAIGLSDDLAHASIRFGLGRFNTEEEVDYTIDCVTETVARLRRMSPLWQERPASAAR